MNTATATKATRSSRSKSNAIAAAATATKKAATKVVPRPEAKPTPAERASRTAKRIADEILASSTPQQAFEDAAVAVLTGKSSRKPHASRPLAVVPAAPAAASPEQMDRLERLAAAKSENAALKAWKAAGSKGAQPATPTIDWMSNASTAERKSSKGSKSTSAKGAPQKMSDAEVRAWVLAQRKGELSSTLATFRAAGHSCAAARFAEIRKAALS